MGAILISLETSNVRLANWAKAPVIGALTMFCVSLLPTLVAIFASIPFLVAHSGFLSSATPWVTLGMLLSALWNLWLESRGHRIRFFVVLPSWMALGGFAVCCAVMTLLEVTHLTGPFFT